MFNKIGFLLFECLTLTILININSYQFGWSPLKVLLDSDSGIICPSGNKAYIHPILGDLQPCSQSLNFYNKSSCPGKGIVCERFPILVPGFQDFCCWENTTTKEEEIILNEKSSLPNIEEESKEVDDKTDINEVLLPVILRPKTKKTKKISTSVKIPKGGTFKKTKKSKKTTTTLPPTTTLTSMEITTTVQLPTTVKQNKVRRGPKCQNPEDSALIDFGNRLRDCYYQSCPRGYRCEINKDLRRYICCGKEASLFLPPGLPPLPSPVPIVPQSFRPNNGRINGIPYFDDEEQKKTYEDNINILDNLRKSNIRQSPRKLKKNGKQNYNDIDDEDNIEKNNRDLMEGIPLQNNCSDGELCESDSSHLIDNENPCIMNDCSSIIVTHRLPCNNCHGPLTR
ncbi:Cysteine-rich repeat-containing protein [Strongyloides ratti]|uniref:Cysteine-rich repeat-containing protein n=1 Tax=Strongyloides ratti TaxID=34506 RepID=A0A090LQW2_STRRB|nr:Cysteine-rich repeat-containing protein [Strongyloides ratti]CEF70571.1 Cysteine-rich repeat-containing protein [Strongyloides ratti]